jgi:two-component system, OmpR family, response regulator
LRILLVEDEPEMARLVVSLVSHAGFVVDRAASLADAFASVRQHPYDLLLLDRRLPDGDSIAALGEFRAMRPGIRAMVLSALDGLRDKIFGLDAGADDYMTKPFQGDELIARIRACVRRPGGEKLPPIVVGALRFDIQNNEASVDGTPLILSRRETMLLKALVQRVSRVASREALVEEIYGIDDQIQANALDTIVSRLRRQLNVSAAGVEIHTVKGRGYLLAEKL